MYSFVSHFFCSVLCIQFICVAADSCDSFICIIIFHCIGEGNGTPLQCSCLENPMDGGSWWATVHGVAKSWTRLSDFTFIFTFLHWRRKWQPTPAFLPGESRGRGSLVGCHLWGCTESNTTEVTYEQQHQSCWSLESDGEVTYRKLINTFPGLAAGLSIDWVVAVHAWVTCTWLCRKELGKRLLQSETIQPAIKSNFP